MSASLVYVPGDPATRRPEFKAWCEAEGIDYFAAFRLEVDGTAAKVDEFVRRDGAFVIGDEEVVTECRYLVLRSSPPVLPTHGFA